MLIRTFAPIVFAALACTFAAAASADPLNDGAATAPAGYAMRPSGLAYRVLKRAESADATPPGAASIVRVRARGQLLDGQEFWRAEKPVEFSLARVIAGWREGLALMRPGDHFSFWIPPDLAYGADGRAPSIPANATLIFDIELIEIIEPSPGDQ